MKKKYTNTYKISSLIINQNRVQKFIKQKILFLFIKVKESLLFHSK